MFPPSPSDHLAILSGVPAERPLQRLRTITSLLDAFDPLLAVRDGPAGGVAAAPDDPSDIQLYLAEECRFLICREVGEFLLDEIVAYAQQPPPGGHAGQPDLVIDGITSLRRELARLANGWNSAQVSRDWVSYRAACHALLAGMVNLVDRRSGAAWAVVRRRAREASREIKSREAL